MAGGMDLGTPSKGGKKPLDMAINLVPFIDLMAVTISFLIMTAVWTQIGRLQVASSGNQTDPTQDQDKTVPLTLVMTPTQLQLSVGPSAQEPIPVTRDAKGGIDLTKLTTQLKGVLTQLHDESAITLQTSDEVRYDDLVHVIDEMVGDGLPNVSVSPMNS